MGREELRRSIGRLLGYPTVSLGMGNRRDRGAGLTCPGMLGGYGAVWHPAGHTAPFKNKITWAATTSVPLTLLFTCIFFSGKLEQEELWQWLQHPPAPRQQAVWDREVRIPVQEE